MRTTAKVDYAVRAAVELARAHPGEGQRPTPVTRQAIADAQDIPAKFLEHILADLKRSGIVGSARGADGGYWLQRPPAEVTVADVIRAVEGPLADVRGERPDALDYPDDLVALQRTWIAVRANLPPSSSTSPSTTSRRRAARRGRAPRPARRRLAAPLAGPSATGGAGRQRPGEAPAADG
ncbi:MAG: Rrf2 family transcriptional regulator [Acidimicrobiales bacterium]